MTLAIDIIEWTQGIEVYIHDKIYGKIVKKKNKKNDGTNTKCSHSCLNPFFLFFDHFQWEVKTWGQHTCTSKYKNLIKWLDNKVVNNLKEINAALFLYMQMYDVWFIKKNRVYSFTSTDWNRISVLM